MLLILSLAAIRRRLSIRTYTSDAYMGRPEAVRTETIT